MKGLDLLMDLGKVSKTEHKVNNEHVPSTIQPDTLFTFTTEFKWLISMLKNKASSSVSSGGGPTMIFEIGGMEYDNIQY